MGASFSGSIFGRVYVYYIYLHASSQFLYAVHTSVVVPQMLYVGHLDFYDI